jgi:hypothetical protein
MRSNIALLFVTKLVILIAITILYACSQQQSTPQYGRILMATGKIKGISNRQMDGKPCGTKYVLSLARTYGPNHAGKDITFGRTVGLERGQVIRGVFVWFENAAQFAALLPDLARDDLTKEGKTQEAILTCGDLLPGYTFFPCSESEDDASCNARGIRILERVSKT